MGLLRVSRALGADAASVLLVGALPGQLVGIVVLGVGVSTTLSMARSKESISRAVVPVASGVLARVLAVAGLCKVLAWFPIRQLLLGSSVTYSALVERVQVLVAADVDVVFVALAGDGSREAVTISSVSTLLCASIPSQSTYT